jgi:hypothetical protein
MESKNGYGSNLIMNIGNFHKVYHLSQESQAIDVSKVESPSAATSPLRILQSLSSKQTTACRMVGYCER